MSDTAGKRPAKTAENLAIANRGTTLIRRFPQLSALFIAASAFAAWGQSGQPADQPAAGAGPANPKYVVDVVTDTKIPQEQKNVTQKVIVLDSADFGQLTTNNRNIAELLQYQPGVAANVLSRNDANWGSYGGLGPKYNSYLLDGLPVDGFIDTMSLDPWAFQRIETHQGPASVLYSNYLSADFAGVQAPLAGITNLVLKDRIDKPMTRLLIGGGSWNTFNARFYHQDHKGNLHYFFGASFEQSDYTNYGTANSWLNILQDPSYKKTKLYGKATYFLGREGHKISFFAQHTIQDGFAGRPNRDFNHNYDTINAVYSNEVNDRLTVQLKTGQVTLHNNEGEDWIVHLLDTGSDTNTGGRVKRVAEFIGDEPFMLTYGDGVANINIPALLEFHKNQGKLVTLTAVRPAARFGQMVIQDGRVLEFKEKPQIGEGWINGGFFVLQPGITDYIPMDQTAWEYESLERIAADGHLAAYQHNDFWQSMDTLRDVHLLEKLWQEGSAPWKIWA